MDDDNSNNIVNFDEIIEEARENYQTALMALSSLPLFLTSVNYDRKFLRWALTMMMLDHGVYEINLTSDTVKDLDAYNLITSGDEDNIKISVVFPDQKPEDALIPLEN